MARLPDILKANVVRLRKARGLKQKDISASSLAMVESGEREWPRPETLEKIAADLGCSAADLITDWDDMQRHPALLEFMKSSMASDLLPVEIVELSRWRPLPGREPTPTTYVLLLQAIRSMVKSDDQNRDGDQH